MVKRDMTQKDRLKTIKSKLEMIGSEIIASNEFGLIYKAVDQDYKLVLVDESLNQQIISGIVEYALNKSFIIIVKLESIMSFSLYCKTCEDLNKDNRYYSVVVHDDITYTYDSVPHSTPNKPGNQNLNSLGDAKVILALGMDKEDLINYAGEKIDISGIVVMQSFLSLDDSTPGRIEVIETCHDQEHNEIRMIRLAVNEQLEILEY